MATILIEQNQCQSIRIVDCSTNCNTQESQNFWGCLQKRGNKYKPLSRVGTKTVPTLPGLTRFLLPLCRAEHRSFWRDQPAGERQGCRSFSEGQEPLPKTLGKSEERRKHAAFGCLFFWILFFGQAKKSIAAAGPRTGV